MTISDEQWANKWSKESFARIAPGVVHDGWGSTGEPSSSIRSATFTEAMGDYFKEGCNLLDYGCGAARYCNFMSGHLKDFIYYGIEPKGGGPFSIYQNVPSMSEEGIRLAQQAYGHDPRVHLGFIGTPLEQEALDTVNIVLLASIFTHLGYEDFISVSNKFLPVIKRGGAVVFSIFLADKYETRGSGAYGFKDTYQMCYYARQQVESYCKENHLSLFEADPWNVTPTLTASIFRFEQ